MGRKKTLAGKIRDCISAVKYWDKNPDAHGAEQSRAVFAKAIKSHLKYAEEQGEVIPEKIKSQALKILGV